MHRIRGNCPARADPSFVQFQVFVRVPRGVKSEYQTFDLECIIIRFLHDQWTMLITGVSMLYDFFIEINEVPRIEPVENR